jgi:hypothetical protein
MVKRAQEEAKNLPLAQKELARINEEITTLPGVL